MKFVASCDPAVNDENAALCSTTHLIKIWRGGERLERAPGGDEQVDQDHHFHSFILSYYSIQHASSMVRRRG